MKKLSQFMVFDIEAFLKGKLLRVTNVSEWVDYTTKVHMGSKVEVAITKDDTQYKQKDGESISNLYEKFNIKIPKDVQVQVNAYVVPVNAVGTVYGEYRNQLSVTADDIRIRPVNK